MNPATGGNGGVMANFFDRLVQFGLEYYGLYYGLYRAQVVSIDDDRFQGKITIRCPAVGDNDQSEPRVAYPQSPCAGPGYGLFMPPRAGDLVWVKFENGKPALPIWVGGWWKTDAMPEEFRQNPPQRYGLKTPRGMLLLLEDKEGEERLTIRSPVGSEIVMTTSGGIQVSQKDGQLVEVGRGADKSAVSGEDLKGLLGEILDAIVQMTVNTAVGASTPPTNLATFQSIKGRLDTMLSQTVKVKK
jgi:hypothetical protein